MSKWEMVKLTDICSPKQWQTIGINEMIDGGKYYVYGANGIIGKYDKYNHEKETILITCRGATCGKINISMPKAYINGNAMCLDNLSNKVLLKYAYYFLLSYDYTDIITGTAQPQITRESLKKIIFPLPPLETQHQIAENLDKVTHLIDLCNAILEKLDLLVKARFLEMFGDFKTNAKGWNIAKFTDIASIDGNMTTDFVKYADYPHIGIDSIEKDTGELKGYRTVSEDNVISGKYIFTPNHIIYSKIRPNLNKVALPDFFGVCSADAYPILPIAKKCNKIFLAYVMRSEFFLDYILQFCTRTNLPKVNRKEVSGFTTPLPPIELQNQFSDFVQSVDKSKSAVKQLREKAETLKKALMQEYFE